MMQNKEEQFIDAQSSSTSLELTAFWKKKTRNLAREIVSLDLHANGIKIRNSVWIHFVDEIRGTLRK